MRFRILRDRVRDLFGLPPLPPRDGDDVPPVPRVVVGLRAALPGALVRLVPGALVVALAALAGMREGWWVVVVAGALVVTLRPRAVLAAAAVGVVALWVLASGDLLAVDPVTGTVPGVWRVAGLVLAVHLLLVAVALAGSVSWHALVEAGVLWRAARSVLPAQAVAQSVVLLVAWVRAGVVGQAEWLRAVAVLAAVVAVLAAVPRSWLVPRPPRQTFEPPPGWVPPEES